LRIAQKATPDLILLDIMMPGIDGYETCARLKADETTQNIVIIFLTALQATEDKVRGLSLGAVDFITKPFDPDEVVAFLNTDGGVLLVGVGDDGDVLGTGADQFENDDKYLLHVNNCIQQYIGLECSSFIRFHLVPVDENNVLLIECQPSPSAVFLKIGKEEEFYVRVGPGSRRLSTSEVLAYMAHRKLEV
jgi:CheY-like chemotaxis protein